VCMAVSGMCEVYMSMGCAYECVYEVYVSVWVCIVCGVSGVCMGVCGV